MINPSRRLREHALEQLKQRRDLPSYGLPADEQFETIVGVARHIRKFGGDLGKRAVRAIGRTEYGLTNEKADQLIVRAGRRVFKGKLSSDLEIRVLDRAADRQLAA